MAKIIKIKCSCCGKELRVAEFYKSSSKLNQTTGKLPICKNCMNDRYEELLTLYGGKTNEAFRHMCFNLDIFYDEGLYIECSSKENFIGEYMRLISSTKDRRDKTSANNSLKSEDINDITLEDGIINADLVYKWGEGYSATEYSKLEKLFNKYSEHYPNKRLQEQEMIKQLCELDLVKEKNRILMTKGQKNEYDKICTQIRRTMDDLKILPKNADDDGEIFNVGHIAEMIEYYEPIPMTTEEFDDINHIEKYVERFLVKPFKRVFGLEEKNVGGINED